MEIVNKTYFDSIDSNVIESIIDEASIRKELMNFEWSKYLKFYLVLTYGAEKIPFIPLDVLYTSRYYWLKIFYHYYSFNFGEDSGFEQQIGKLVEEMSNTLNDYDWSLLEKISKEIENIKV